jgi:4-oxalocrotonate tautomerase
MPIVKIELWKGRSKEQKRKLVGKVTSAVVDSVSCPAEAVQVVVAEIEKENWGIAGQLASEKFPDK